MRFVACIAKYPKIVAQSNVADNWTLNNALAVLYDELQRHVDDLEREKQRLILMERKNKKKGAMQQVNNFFLFVGEREIIYLICLQFLMLGYW